MKYLKAIVAAIVSGCLLGLAMPPFGYGFLGWIALVPLFVAVSTRGFLVGFVGGLITGLTPAVLLANNLVPTPYPMPGEPNWIYAGFLIFGALLGAMGGIAGEGKTFGLRKAVLYAVIAVLLEFALTWKLPEHMALSQSRFGPALFLASVTGIWGVSFWVWLTNLAIAASITNRRRLAWIAVAWLVVFAPLWGVHRFDENIFQDDSDQDFAIAVVQTDSQEIEVLRRLNAEAGKTANVVIWPEMSAVAMAPRGDTKELRQLSKEPNQPAFITSFEDELRVRPHNTAALFSLGAESDRYFKRRPFSGELLMHRPGDRAVSAKWAQYVIGLNICFDSCYPDIMRDTAKLPGVDFIALPTEDPPSNGAVVQSIHASYTPFRAAELGMTIARADITARSMIVGPYGEVMTELGTGEGITSAQVPPSHMTLYRHYGDWFVWLCLAYVIVSILWGLIARRPAKLA